MDELSIKKRLTYIHKAIRYYVEAYDTTLNTWVQVHLHNLLIEYSKLQVKLNSQHFIAWEDIDKIA